MRASSASRTRTDRSSPARAARRRMRWASWRASTACGHAHADVVLGPVEHRAEGGRAGVFHLPEGGLGLGLGPVGGDYPGGRPVVVVGDQDVLAEDIFFQGGAGAGVDVPGEAVVLGGISGQLPGDDAVRPGVVQDLADLGFDLRPGRRVLPRARVAASSSSFRPALAKVVPVNPRACFSCSSGEWVRIARARRRKPRGGCRKRSARRSGPDR